MAAESPQALIQRLREQAWDEGYNAAANGKRKNVNPYRKQKEKQQDGTG